MWPKAAPPGSRARAFASPKRGLLVIWNNMTPDGTPNYDTLHEGMRVLEGMKYIVTKWFREEAWIKDYVQTYIAGGIENAGD